MDGSVEKERGKLGWTFFIDLTVYQEVSGYPTNKLDHLI
jgi:hypothetical protein